MGNKVSLVLVIFLTALLPGLGIFLVPERGTVHSLFGVAYILATLAGWVTVFFFGLGLLLIIPAFFCAAIHSSYLVSRHNKGIDAFRASDAAARADLEERVSQLSDA